MVESWGEIGRQRQREGGRWAHIPARVGKYVSYTLYIYTLYTHIPSHFAQHSPNKKYTPDKLNSIYVVDAYYKYLSSALVSVVCNHRGQVARRMAQHSTRAAGIYCIIFTQLDIIEQASTLVFQSRL